MVEKRQKKEPKKAKSKKNRTEVNEQKRATYLQGDCGYFFFVKYSVRLLDLRHQLIITIITTAITKYHMKYTSSQATPFTHCLLHIRIIYKFFVFQFAIYCIYFVYAHSNTPETKPCDHV